MPSKPTANKHIVESVIFAIRIELNRIVCTRKSNSCQVQLFKPNNQTTKRQSTKCHLNEYICV